MAITKVTRRAIIELLRNSFETNFYGMLDEVGFWGRVFDLTKLPSSDPRYADMRGDLWQHRINNYDWEEDWYIEKLDLLGVDDTKFLKFMSEFFHPEVREPDWNTNRVIQKINDNLRFDSIELYSKSYISGRPVLGAKRVESSSLNSQFTAAMIENDLLTIEIRPEIYNHIKTYLQNDDYFHAVEESYKVVRQKLKDITGKEKATDAFAERNLATIFGHEAKDGTERDFFDGAKYLHMSIQFLRNEKVHTLAMQLDKNLAIHYISLASLAYDLLTKEDD